MRVAVMSVIVLINFVLQTTLFRGIELFGVKPNTAVLIVVCYAVLREDIEGCIIGFFAGLLYDIFFSNYIGFCALQYAIIGYFCGKPFRDFFRENDLLPFLLSIGAMLFYGFTYYIVNFLLLARTDFMRYVKDIIIPETIYTVILAIPAYRILYAINKRLERREDKRKSMFNNKSI